MGRPSTPAEPSAPESVPVRVQFPANRPPAARKTAAPAPVTISAQALIGRGRPVWRPMFYGLVLILVATVLTAASPVSSWWFIYGLACDFVGLGFLPVAAVRLRQAHDLKAATAALEASGGVIAPFRPVPAQAKPQGERSRQTKAGPTAVRSAPSGGLPGLKVTQFRVIRSEWTKLYSLRSSKIVLLVAAVLLVGTSATVSAVVNSQWDKLTPAAKKAFDPGAAPMAGAGLAQLAVGVFGVLLISGEYATGMIRSSLTAVPQRSRFVLAKLTVLMGSVGVTSLVGAVAAFQVAQAIWAPRHIATHLGAPHTLRPVLGASLYLVLMSVLGMGLGVLLRHTAAAITSLVGLLFLAPIVINFLPADIGTNATRFLPATAGQEFWAKPDGGWTGLLILIAWAGGTCLAGFSRLISEDV